MGIETGGGPEHETGFEAADYEGVPGEFLGNGPDVPSDKIDFDKLLSRLGKPYPQELLGRDFGNDNDYHAEAPDPEAGRVLERFVEGFRGLLNPTDLDPHAPIDMPDRGE